MIIIIIIIKIKYKAGGRKPVKHAGISTKDKGRYGLRAETILKVNQEGEFKTTKDWNWILSASMANILHQKYIYASMTFIFSKLNILLCFEVFIHLWFKIDSIFSFAHLLNLK